MPRGIYKHNPQYKETKEKISNTLKGRKFTEEHKRNLKKALKGKVGVKKGAKFSIKTREKMSKAHLGKNNREKHYNWQGGKSFEPYSIEWTKTLKISIRERDKYRCKLCGEPQGDKAHHVHHIDYDKKNCNPNNLVTLCNKCHQKTNFKRDYWKKFDFFLK